MSLKKVDVVSSVVHREQSGKRVPTGNNIFITGSGADIDAVKAEVMLEIAKEFISKVKDDTAEGVINFLAGIRIANMLISGLLTLESSDEATDENIMSSARVIREIEDAIKELDDRYLSKIKDDRTPFKLNVGDKLTAEKGVQIGKSFIPGILTGSGGYFDEFANGEVESLIIRRFLEVPELRYNRVQVTLGDKWNAPGAGVIERVVPDSETTGTVFLKLEEGEYGAVAVGDICMGIFHSETESENATADYDDGRGNFMFAGFYTCYFTITGITGKNNAQFSYQLRPTSERWKLQHHPSEAMHFVCYGSFSNGDRQTSVYTTRTYTRLLKNQNTWEISAANIAMQYGNMDNMNVHGLDMAGYSMYLNNIYMTGVFKQVKPDGTPVQVANDRGAWVSGTAYEYYDRVSYKGSLWLCVNESGTNTEPRKGNSDWLLQVSSGDSLVIGGRFSSAKTPYQPNSVIDFADRVWSSTEAVDYAPYGIWTDKDGNRFQFADEGFCLVDDAEVQTGWTIFFDLSDVKDGVDGKSLIVQYSADGSAWHDVFQEGDVYMRQKLGEDGVWSEKIRIVGEAGAAGENGEYTEYEFAVGDSVDVAPTGGWQDAPPSVGQGQYLWMRMRVVHGDGTAENWSEPVRIGGEKGDSVEFIGRFRTGTLVKALSVVEMGEGNWVAKVSTMNPPLWTWVDASGNRFVFSDGGYALTGEENEAEYELMANNGKDGKDGTDFEFIFRNTTEEVKPMKPSSEQEDDYIPTGWHDDPLGVSESVQFEWMCLRKKADGLWGEYSEPALWAKFGEDGVNWEFVYQRTTANRAPSVPKSKQEDDYVPEGWTDDPMGVDEEYQWEWMAKRRKKGSVWGEYSEPALWANFGDTSFKSTVFLRSNSQPATPSGGSYESPIPTSSPAWSDGIPSGEQILWASTRVFTKSGKGIQASSWTMPRQMTDTASFEAVYHASEKEPTPPTNYPTTPGAWSPNNGWTDDPGTNSVWMATATKANGVWGAWKVSKIKGEQGEQGPQGEQGVPGEDGAPGEQGIQGCIIRKSEWTSGTQFRNDEALTYGTRYLDVALVRDDSLTTGWAAYKCLRTHTASASNKPGSGTYWTTYWEEFAMNANAIFTSLIIAKNASISFLQGNELLIKGSDGVTVEAGLSGSSATGGDIRLWVGGRTPGSAAFTVDKYGKMVATEAEITGVIYAEGGTIGGFTINEKYMSSGNLSTGLMTLSPEALGFKQTGGLQVLIGPEAVPDVSGVECGLYSEAPSTGYSIMGKGSASFVARAASEEHVYVSGFSVCSQRGTSLSLTSAYDTYPYGTSVDFLVMTGNASLPNPRYHRGRVVFVKCKSSYDLSVPSVLDSNGNSRNSTYKDSKSRFFVSDGTNWHEFYCA